MLEWVLGLICLGLILLNGFVIWFYQKQINVLIDKAMSKSYPDYVFTKNLEQAEPFPQAGTQEKASVDDDLVLNELNRMLL